MIGIVSDDITGANDIGVMYAKAGLRTYVYPMDAWPDETGAVPMPDVLVVDTNSRLDGGAEAYGKVYRMTQALRAAGCDRFINKTCSVFRGNIGAEFDAMLDALGVSFAVVVLGFPKNGRTTLGGVHYVHGQKLEDSEFRNDPANPMRQSNLVEILQAQTERKVDSVSIDIVEQGAAALRAEMDRMREACSYLILDVRDQRSLGIIAEAVRDEPVLCGSSALSEELALLPELRGRLNPEPEEAASQGTEGNVLCAAGSLMPQTAAQIACAKREGIAAYELDSLRLLRAEEKSAHVREVVDNVCGALEQGRDVLVHTTTDVARIAVTKRAGRSLGMSNTDVSRLVSDALSDAVKAAVDRAGVRKLLIAGGETSAAVCAKLGIGGQQVLREIEPGLPSCRSLGKPPYDLVLKSGSFGGEIFFIKAVRHLKSL
ncbi:MAG TPA: four-carbon acid sugar kinase family protein [Paenibacillus sp.]|uniref:four-carbon acid sugar kinase family protein n=1 Tax=Paenibacillus sp. TaxID=58172 RepID=UPI0028D22216|nr:four-carbon acid sugar kinase family protein [Paenibacillus sp.]HUC91652.1 four-carbon acid sugar kinase family protein [Paenibacillus sp.]